ncbi:reverse transcriptase domain-containing protein [Tanacetum coccineum]
MAMVVREDGPPDDDTWEPRPIKKRQGKKKRLCAALIRKFELGEKKRLSIKFDLHELRTAKPIGPNRRHFTGLIGNEIERSVPFCYESWDLVPDKHKGTIWPAINVTYFDMKEHLSGPNAKQVEKGMELQFKGQYRNRKNKFKDEMFVRRGHLAHSAKNKANRAKLPQCSTQGSKSYAASRHEEWETNGVFPDLIELYKKTHQKEGKWAKDVFEARYIQHPESLRLVADGFNPFGNLSQSYSMWPVILTTYNTPPWICMKESSFMLACLIPGPKSPGVKTLDVATNTEFSMRAMLLWTISDFPARSSLSGWSGQGYLACPTCNDETPSTRVNGKTAYVGHRRFLPMKHHWRNDKTFNEAILGGPVYMRWMYPFERYMKKLKNYVRNKARPEGCIAEGYIAEEALTFCSHYLRNVPTKFNRPDRNDDGPPPTSELQVFRSACTPKSAGVGKKLDHEVKKKLVWYVLDNSPEIDQYKTECCLAMPENDLPTKFSPWFRDKISTLYTKNPSECSLELFALAVNRKILHLLHATYICYGVKFVVRSRDERLITQNSGVSTPGENGSMFYGLLEEIITSLEGCQEVNHRKIWDKDVIVDADVVHDSNLSDVALTANLEDLEYTRLSGAGPSMEVSFIPTSRVNDDDFIDDDVEYDAVHVLSSDSEDEDSD